jgi:hypothetical protein
MGRQRWCARLDVAQTCFTNLSAGPSNAATFACPEVAFQCITLIRSVINVMSERTRWQSTDSNHSIRKLFLVR